MQIDTPEQRDFIIISQLIQHWAAFLGLPLEQIWLTTRRTTFYQWRGRHPGSTWGCYSPPLAIRSKTGRLSMYMQNKLGLERVSASNKHVIYLNLPRLRNIEIVLVEELIHARDYCRARETGQKMRRHTHHGEDEIAKEVAELLGLSLTELKEALIPRQPQPIKYIYVCPTCAKHYPRRRRLTKRASCSVCDPRKFNLAHELIQQI